ncbi:anti-sigma regulatory factor [Bacillus sp. FJAT-27225]|uniref:anti-sigma regulatory factor n=1 Tax=Bacillus sp. FJAT-27225 TaxID=1743144 RepID=UPI0011127578|nr:anti-sigma regulatory factor [Bacillus sp. FJAT-27225]
MHAQSYIEISGEHDIMSARQEARQAAKKLGFSLFDQSRIITLISELARNIYKYAGYGRIYIEEIKEHGVHGLCFLAIDDGPGIVDVDRAMKQGFSTSGSLGAGLPAMKRMADEFSIETVPGKGTCIKIIKWLY